FPSDADGGSRRPAHAGPDVLTKSAVSHPLPTPVACHVFLWCIKSFFMCRGVFFCSQTDLPVGAQSGGSYFFHLIFPHVSFVGYLEREYDKMNSNLKATLEEAEFVSTTADIWTVNKKRFMGLTHWINSTLQRNKAALACKRIKGSHTYDVIGAEIEEIHSSYGLQDKVIATVMDNASNFPKAFRVCQPCHLESESENEEGDDEEPTFTDVIEALSTASGDAQFSLPQHYRCASHIINLISTSDVDKHLNSCADTTAAYRSSIAKCSALWTEASRSTSASEQVEEAISRIITLPLNEPNPLCVKLGINCLNEREFLKEYCTVMKPLTVALDILQGDECTCGALLPTLTSLIKIILFLDASCCMLQAIKTRFDAVLDSQEGLLAAATCPKFKHLNKFKGESIFQILKKMYMKYNSPTPSSAAVERLFSLGGLVLSPKGTECLIEGLRSFC
uniref:HAT C-terminal dimerisation domain-containing protein n=1 Tax=Neolamprologus brichardi TaxID=32507 RepID=A0A3Q4HMB2_NEOBR